MKRLDCGHEVPTFTFSRSGLTKEEWMRMRDLVNACAGMSDPQAAIDKAREALREAIEQHDDPKNVGRLYDGIPDGIREALRMLGEGRS